MFNTASRRDSLEAVLFYHVYRWRRSDCCRTECRCLRCDVRSYHLFAG